MFSYTAMAELMNLSSESDSDEEMDMLMLLYNVSKRDKLEWKSSYMNKRGTHGEYALTSEFSDKQFTNYFRLDRSQFHEVHELVRKSIFSEGCNAQKPIGTEEKLAVFLRYLATGDSYKSIAYSYRMGDRTVSNIVKEVSHAMWETMQPAYLPQPTAQMWKTIAECFEQRWQFPRCIGAIDGKHIVVKKPGNSGSSFFNYKHTHSVVLMATVDANYKFITIDVGSMGRFSDGNIFSSSTLAKKLQRQNLQLPAHSEQELPYVFVGDEAFPLLDNLMRPYPNRSVTDNYRNKVFNYRLSRARQTCECAFGILASRFRCFRKPFEIKIDSVDSVVKAACVLHNYLRSDVAADSNGNDDNVAMPNNQLLPLIPNNSRSAISAFVVREKFTEYFNTVGSVSWQADSISKGKY